MAVDVLHVSPVETPASDVERRCAFSRAALMVLLFVAWIALLIVSNFRHARYAMPVLPLLCFLFALVFYRVLTRAQFICWRVPGQ